LFVVELLLLSLFLLLPCSFSFAQNKEMNDQWGLQDKTTTLTDSERGKLYIKGNYAMFVHWGLYSQLGCKWNDKSYCGVSEWNQTKLKIKQQDMMDYAKQFNPVNFSATKLVSLAKNIGIKYIVITAKHYDGFVMYHSKVSDFNIVDASPCGRDPMKEMAAECAKQGVELGFYYSHNFDWTAPGGTMGPKTNAAGDSVSFDQYFYSKCLPQVKEITSEYGPLALIWFDCLGSISPKYTQKLADLVHNNQPNAFINGRIGNNMGDYKGGGDMEVPQKRIDGLSESCDVTNDSWGWAYYDENWKNPKLILTNVLSIVARGGNYLMNVPPGPDGTVPERVEKILTSTGKWIQKYLQVVYGSEASPGPKKFSWGDVVSKENKLYLLVYEWNVNGELWLPGLKSEIKLLKFLNAKNSKLKYELRNNTVVIKIPALAPEKYVSVIELELKNEVSVDESPTIDPYLPTYYSAYFAEAKNCILKNKQWMEKFGECKSIMQLEKWTKDSKATWTFDILKPGDYLMDLQYAGDGRLAWKIETSDAESIQNQ
jgi:alpha-L-fucosidase